MTWYHSLQVNDQGYVDTDGVYYGPYDALTLLWQGERLAVVHCKGHTQYWGQTAHYIPARILVFERKGSTAGIWLVEVIKETETGRASRRGKSNMIAWAKKQEQA